VLAWQKKWTQSLKYRNWYRYWAGGSPGLELRSGYSDQDIEAAFNLAVDAGIRVFRYRWNLWQGNLNYPGQVDEVKQGTNHSCDQVHALPLGGLGKQIFAKALTASLKRLEYPSSTLPDSLADAPVQGADMDGTDVGSARGRSHRGRRRLELRYGTDAWSR